MNAPSDVLAAFPAMDQGRDAIDALEAAGIDGRDIAVMGKPGRGGRVVLGVHSADPDEIVKATEILRRLQPLEIVTFDRDGRQADRRARRNPSETARRV